MSSVKQTAIWDLQTRQFLLPKLGHEASECEDVIAFRSSETVPLRSRRWRHGSFRRAQLGRKTRATLGRRTSRR